MVGILISFQFTRQWFHNNHWQKNIVWGPRAGFIYIYIYVIYIYIYIYIYTCKYIYLYIYIYTEVFSGNPQSLHVLRITGLGITGLRIPPAGFSHNFVRPHEHRHCHINSIPLGTDRAAQVHVRTASDLIASVWLIQRHFLILSFRRPLMAVALSLIDAMRLT